MTTNNGIEIFEILSKIFEPIEKFISSPVGLFVLVALFIGLILYMQFNKPEKKGDESFKELQRAGKNNFRGVLLGRKGSTFFYSPVEDEGHIGVFGGSGSGKTSAVLIPSLRSWCASGGNFFAIDISGDIASNVGRFIPKDKRIVINTEKESSIKYNVFGPIDKLERMDEITSALERLALLLMPDNPDSTNEASKFFRDNGRTMLEASLIAFYDNENTDERYPLMKPHMDFVEICELIYKSSFEQLKEMIELTEVPEAVALIAKYNPADRNINGCIGECTKAIESFAKNSNLQRTIGRPQVKPDGKKEKAYTPGALEKYNVFIRIPDSKLEQYGAFMRLITTQTLEYFSTRPKDKRTPLLFALDEFASFGEMDIIGAFRKLRKNRIRIMIVTQSLADLDSIYGRESRRSIMDNMNYKIVLSAGDPDTQMQFAQMIGRKETVNHSQTTSSNNSSNTTSETEKWAIDPAEFSKLGKNLVLIHPKGFCKLVKAPYFKIWEKDYQNNKRR